MADVLDEVRRGASALALVVEQASAVWPKVSAALRATCDDVEHRVTRVDNVVLLVGTSSAKRRLLNALLGEEVLPAAAGERVRLTVRRGNAREYVAETAHGTRSLGRDRTADLAAEVERAEQAAARAAALVEELKEMRAQTESSPVVVQAPPSSTKALGVAAPESASDDAGEDGEVRAVRLPWLTRVVFHILAFFGVAHARARLAPPPGPAKRRELVAAPAEPVMLMIVETPPAIPVSIDERVALEMRLLEAEAAVPKARADAAEARAAHAAYEAERRARFSEEISALLAAAAVTSIDIEHPSPSLSRNVVLVDEQVNTDEDTRTWRRARRQVCACVVVTNGSDSGDFVRIATEQLKPLTPFRIDLAEGLRGELAIAHLFDALRREARPALAALAIADVLGVLRSLAEAGDKAEAECRARIAEIEKSRTPDPATFRAAQLETLQPVVTDAAGRVMRGALERWRASIAALRAEWTASIEGAADRAAVEAIVKTLNDEAPGRLASALEALTSSIGDDIQSTTTTLQGWMLDDVSVRFRSLSVAPDAPVVLVDDVADEIPSAREIPLAKVVDTFERRRVGIGLGGAAAGAALGTLIFPGIGTAVGAFVGVLAGFIETVANLKRDAVARLGAHLDSVEAEVVAQLQAAHDGFAREMSASLVEVLDAELARRADAIARQIEGEGAALEREAVKLVEVETMRAGLVRHRARFASLEKDVMDALERAVESRAPRSPSRPLDLLPIERA